MLIDPRLITQVNDDKVFVTALSLNKTLKSAIEDGDLAGGGGGSAQLVFNSPVLVSGGVTSITGLSYFMAPSSFNLGLFRVVLFQKSGVSSGTLEVDIKYNTTPNNAGMTSLLSTKPTFDFSVDADFSLKSGVFSSTAIANNGFIRLDITSKPASWSGTIQVICYGT
jgi:hypothetical protein